jgi:hypothetical protein
MNNFQSKIRQSVNAKLCQAENMTISAINEVSAAVDTGISTRKKAYVTVAGLCSALVTAGIAIAAVTAPVPVAIGLCIFWLMDDAIDRERNSHDDHVIQKSKRREFEKTIKLLKKYGTLPENAKVSTPCIELTMNTRAGTVQGVILQGHYKGQLLENITLCDIQSLISAAPDNDTRALLEAYLKIRLKND